MDEVLLKAAAEGDLAAVEAALRNGAAKDATSDFGFTALHVAATYGRLSIVQRLINAGADLDRRDRHGISPLLQAVAWPDVMAALLDAGSNVDSATFQGVTPLMSAAALGEMESVRLLVAHGADLSRREYVRGFNAAECAGEKGEDVIESYLSELIDGKLDMSVASDAELVAAADPSRIAVCMNPARISGTCRQIDSATYREIPQRSLRCGASASLPSTVTNSHQRTNGGRFEWLAFGDSAAMTQLPTAREINPHGDLDGNYAERNFLGKSVREAELLFVENSLHYQEDLMFMGAAGFRFYVHAAINYIQSEAATGDCGMISCFASILEFRLEHEASELTTLASDLSSACDRIVADYQRFEVIAEIYGDLKTRYEALSTAFTTLASTTPAKQRGRRKSP